MTREALEGLGNLVSWESQEQYSDFQSELYKDYGPDLPNKNERNEQKKQVVARLKSALLMLGVDLK